MEQGLDLRVLLVFMLSFLLSFIAVMGYSLTLPGAPFGPKITFDPNGTVSPPPDPGLYPDTSQEVNVTAENSGVRQQDLAQSAAYWRNTTPIAIQGMVRTGDLLSVAFVSKTDSNVTLNTLNISGNVGEMNMALRGRSGNVRSFMAQGACAPGEYRVYWVSYTYTLWGNETNQTGMLAGEKPFIVRCEYSTSESR